MKFVGSPLFVFLVIVFIGSTLLIDRGADFERTTDNAPQNQGATSSTPLLAATTTVVTSATTTTATSTSKKTIVVPKKISAKATEIATSTPAKNPDAATRIQNPYPFPAGSFTTINEKARGALVNILCTPREGGLLPTSGSGVIIDPRGVILTNAHVAQYVLLSESRDIDLSCVIRVGSPAVSKWHAVVIYIPTVWVKEHVSEIKSQQAFGTGEHDYALLLITNSVDGQTYTTYPSLSVDTRQAIGFEGDPVLVASYPAELAGGFTAQNGLYAASSQTTIQKLLTFVVQTVDLISLGGVIEAQSGSSGGAVVNAWGRLIGLIATTSAGGTTGDRDLHALTLSYIDRDLASQTGHNLTEILNSNVTSLATDFTQNAALGLIQKYIDTLTGHTQ